MQNDEIVEIFTPYKQCSNLTRFIFFQNFSIAILKNKASSKKCAEHFFLLVDLEKIFFVCFLCHEKKSHTSFDQFELTCHFCRNPRHIFVQCSVSQHVQPKFQRIWIKFTKVGAFQRQNLGLCFIFTAHSPRKAVNTQCH